MLDINFLRKNILFVSKKLLYRNFVFDINFFNSIDSEIRNLKFKIYLTQYEYNIILSLIKNIYFKKKKSNFFFNKSDRFKANHIKNKNRLYKIEESFKNFLLNIPNLLHDAVPFGVDFKDNIDIRSFLSKNNLLLDINKKFLNDIEDNKDFIDFDTASKISGSGFVFIKGKLAELYRALGYYMLDIHINIHGYKEINPPLMVNETSMFNSGHFPKFFNQQFNIVDKDLWLIPTSEVSLTNMFVKKVLDINNINGKYVSKTVCFRKEKGNYGYNVRGLIRQHQFDKVELLHTSDNKNSYNSLEELLYNSEKILQLLDLPYRIIKLCSGDTGFTSAKTYDIEVWLPKRKIFLEVSSCSNIESFQSVRMNFKYKILNKFFYPHILNGSGLAIGRTLLAIIENYSEINGDVIIPDVLRKYTKFDVIRISEK
jgi:seryl-tRNA synthetase